MGKKRTDNSEEKPLSHKILGVASGQEKQETIRRLRSQQKLELQLRNINDELLNEAEDEFTRQTMLAMDVVKIPINLPLDCCFCKEIGHLFKKMVFSARENVPETVLRLLKDRLMDKFGRSYSKFVARLWANVWLKVHLRCLQEDAGLSNEEMAKMHPLQLLKLLDAVNNTHTPSVERKIWKMVSEFGLDTPCSYPVQDIFTELVEKMFKAFAEAAPDDFAKIAHRDAMAQSMTLAVRGISLAGYPIN